MFKKRLITALVLGGLMFLMVASGSALAARGGGGGKHGGGGTTSAGTLTVSPNPAPLGITQITISGAGFGAGRVLGVGIYGYLPMDWVTTDSTGAFSLAYSVFDNRWIYSGTVFVTDS